MKNRLAVFVGVLIVAAWTGTSFAELGGQVFFRGSAAIQKDDEPDMGGSSSGSTGYAVGAGLDIPLTKDSWQNTLLGEVMVEYAKFLDAALPASELAVVIAPKYRLELGKFRPWIIPVGLAFLVNSAPSPAVTYLELGLHFGAGAEYRLTDLLSLGLDYRYNLGLGLAAVDTHYGTIGSYVGINF